jgi:predicted small lipoprotein YifL
MKAPIVAGLIVLGFTLAGCGGRQPVEINPDAQSVGPRWNGTLSAPPELAGVSDIRGQGWMAADPKDPGQTRAHVSVSNAVPGGRHPWHVHRGQCGSDQGILGPADAYKPLKVESDGRAVSDAVLSIPLPKSGSYFINVHASASNLKTIVACGNLAPPAR